MQAKGSCWRLAALIVVLAASAARADIVPERRDELRHLLRHDCGSCHGLRLSGGLGPPLTPASLAHKSASDLVATIRYGRPGTPMPPWSGLLSAEETRWLVDLMKAGRVEAATK